jgi:hypothetical protein
MFIPNSDNQDQLPSVDDVMDATMSHLWNTYIRPNVDESDQEEAQMLTLIGKALRDIQDKASAYDKLQSEKDYFSRN